MTAFSTTRTPSTTRRYPREELEETMRRWLEANRKAEAEGDWKKHLGPFYTADAEYRWTVGPGEEFVAIGQKQIADWACGVHMEGFEGWNYPYDKVLYDDVQGEIVAFWRQVSPTKGPDGKRIEVPGVGGSWFRYGGDHKWAEQRDFFDLLSVFSTFAQVAAAGDLGEPIKHKLANLARGKEITGHQRLGRKPSLGDRLRQGRAMAKVFLLGR